MIGYYTNNTLSHTVMGALAKAGQIEPRHIYYFGGEFPKTCVFYGILRGTGNAMNIMSYLKQDYWYIDNGYFDAVYIDSNMHKEMTGSFRVVKNGMLEPYAGLRDNKPVNRPKTALLIPPSPYSAHQLNTTPEDWSVYCESHLKRHGYKVTTRDKSDPRPLDKALDGIGLLISMHSMACMRAIELGIPAYDTHGIFRNAEEIEADDFQPRIVTNIENLRTYYEPKQFTLEEMAAGKVVWN